MVALQRQHPATHSSRTALVVVGLIVGLFGHGCGRVTPAVMHETGVWFPDEPGNEWRYRGHTTEGAVHRITETTFVNISTVTGREKKDGVMAVVFHDTNPGDRGPTESYYFQDAAGVRYYGSKPGTVLERQLIPYQIVKFPLERPGSFQQLDRKNLNLGLDIDHDNKAETVDIQATVTTQGRETVTVPLGTYQAVRLEARMKLFVRLSRDGTEVHGSDTMTVWFVKGLGVVKYIERQMIPKAGKGKGLLIEITEELEEAKIQGGTVMLGRRDTPTYHVPVGRHENHRARQSQDSP